MPITSDYGAKARLNALPPDEGGREDFAAIVRGTGGVTDDALDEARGDLGERHGHSGERRGEEARNDASVEAGDGEVHADTQSRPAGRGITGRRQHVAAGDHGRGPVRWPEQGR